MEPDDTHATPNSSDRYRDLINRYRELARLRISLQSFYAILVSDGLSKFDRYVLMRDLMGLDFFECHAVDNQWMSSQK